MSTVKTDAIETRAGGTSVLTIGTGYADYQAAWWISRC